MTDAAPEYRQLPPTVRAAVEGALGRKAIDPVLLQVTEICDFADYFLLCSGSSGRQVRAIQEAVEKSLRRRGERALHVEGLRKAKWVLMDYGDLVIHVFDDETREFYRLERLWGDAPRVELDAIESGNGSAGGSPDEHAEDALTAGG